MIEPFRNSLSKITRGDVLAKANETAFGIGIGWWRNRRGRNPFAGHVSDRGYVRRQVPGEKRALGFVPFEFGAGLMQQPRVGYKVAPDDDEIASDVCIFGSQALDAPRPGGPDNLPGRHRGRDLDSGLSQS